MTGIQRDRAMAYLYNCDPDELVDILCISSRELMLMFPEKVTNYIEEVSYEQDDQKEDLY